MATSSESIFSVGSNRIDPEAERLGPAHGSDRTRPWPERPARGRAARERSEQERVRSAANKSGYEAKLALGEFGQGRAHLTYCLVDSLFVFDQGKSHIAFPTGTKTHARRNRDVGLGDEHRRELD